MIQIYGCNRCDISFIIQMQYNNRSNDSLEVVKRFGVFAMQYISENKPITLCLCDIFNTEQMKKTIPLFMRIIH